MTHDQTTRTVPAEPGLPYAGYNLSWRSVIAGIFTFLALNVLFVLIGLSVGLGVPDFQAAHPFENVGVGLIIWLVISIIISFAAAGFVTGITANRLGTLHGFLTWASGVIVGTVLLLAGVSALFGTTARTLSAITQTSGQALSGATSSVTDVIANISEEAYQKLADEITIDTEELNTAVKETLGDTDIEVLQPDYLSKQIDATISDAEQAAYNVIVDNKDVEKELDHVYQNIEKRVQTIQDGVSREDLEAEVAKNTDLSQAEVNQAVDNILAAYDQFSQEAETSFNQAKDNLDEFTKEAEIQAKEVKTTTQNVLQDVTNYIAKYAIYLFIGLVAAALLTMVTSRLGVKYAATHFE